MRLVYLFWLSLLTAYPLPVLALPAKDHASYLLIPVEGISAKQLRNSFNDRRGSLRTHQAIDIFAPRNTPVLAVADGKIVKLFNSKRGGLTLYQFDRSEKLAYYYAHLDGYAIGIKEGRDLKRGDLLGYVGTTGNAQIKVPHLHFAVFKLSAAKQWWHGRALNPYPLMGGLKQ